MASNRKKEAIDEEEHKAETAGMMRWLLTYADMITLLLGMFIVIAGSRQENEAKFKILASQAARVFGAGQSTVFNGQTGMLQGSNGILPYFKPSKESKPGTPTGPVQVKNTPYGILITMSSGIMYDSGSADLKPNAKAIIDKVYQTYFAKNNDMIRITGHTDDRPISGMYPSNWELSTARAGAVARYLISRWHITPSRLTTQGSADTQPKASNVTPEGRAANRRVELWVLKGQAGKVEKELNNASTESSDALGGGQF